MKTKQNEWKIFIFETEKVQKITPVDYQPLTEKGRNYLKEERKLPEWLIDYAEKEGVNC